MPSKDYRHRLRDIFENLQAIESFIAGLGLAAFCADRKTVYAVTRALEIISEASRHLPVELKQRYPEVDWPAVAAAGSVHRHEYKVVDNAILWRTVSHELPVLDMWFRLNSIGVNLRCWASRSVLRAQMRWVIRACNWGLPW